MEIYYIEEFCKRSREGDLEGIRCLLKEMQKFDKGRFEGRDA